MNQSRSPLSPARSAPRATDLAAEARLLARARAGDERAFRTLVEPLRERIYWRAAKAVKDLDEAEDITQETLLRAFTRLETFRGEARFSSWLFQVGSNCIRMHLRSKKRRGTQRLDDHAHELEQTETPTLGLATAATAPDRLVMDVELARALQGAISNLPPQYGSILRLWVEDGLDLKQIHERSGLSIAAIKSRLHRARRRVRDAIEARYGAGAMLAPA